jgi:hypothetical protein
MNTKIIAITVNQTIFQKSEITLHPEISLVTTNLTITHRSKFISLEPWSSRHEYQDYCHHGEPGHISKSPIHDGIGRLEQAAKIFLEAYDVQMWEDLIGSDLENKPQWDTYYCKTCHHGEPGYIKNKSDT